MGVSASRGDDGSGAASAGGGATDGGAGGGGAWAGGGEADAGAGGIGGASAAEVEDLIHELQARSGGSRIDLSLLSLLTRSL